MFLILFSLFNGLLDGLRLFILDIYIFSAFKFTPEIVFNAFFMLAGVRVFLGVKSLLK